MTNTFLNYKAATLFLLSIFPWIQKTLCIICFCEKHCSENQSSGSCEVKSGGHCFVAVKNIWEPEKGEYIQQWTSGCLSSKKIGSEKCESYLMPRLQGHLIKCCNETSFCNSHEIRIRPTLATRMTISSQALLILSVASLSVSLFLFSLSIVIIYHRYSTDDTKAYPTPKATQSNLRDLIDQSSGSGSGLQLLVERTIAKQLTLFECIGKGRYGEVWMAKWRADKVAVKIFLTSEESAWFKEIEIYNTVLMIHENILGCIAADIQGTGTWTQMLLITDYHENGSLFEYLQAKILDKTALLKICLSMAAGIAYLHTEIFGTPGKPALAHRDIKSKNILIKRNGECAIADFGLAVRFSSKSGTIDAVSDIRVGTRRYMAPEVLDQTLDVTSFNAFKMADVYSMGLVLWEACRRCTTDFRTSVVDFYSLPYQDVVPSNPSFEDMKLVVCVKRLRPPMPTRWESDTVLYSLRQTILECWHQVPGVRLTALRVQSLKGIIQWSGYSGD
ncbi:bone morphogenetic protein receptor type-1B isoform X2 [Cephus cinctus]|uniref:receptor protein serine/threonine kinase n=1 Tax=Cephus cinctus TaxID=211228 RepID=A0AAJ7FFP9_CEPCN|nr:bone morphogenetic protein receptor type-1B isoform X2 [Cephus cinctus]